MRNGNDIGYLVAILIETRCGEKGGKIEGGVCWLTGR